MLQTYHSEDSTTLQPLLTSLCYEYTNRPVRDRVWGILYTALLGASLLGGAYAVVNRNPTFDLVVKGDYLKDPAHCPAVDPTLGLPIGNIAGVTAGGTHGWAARVLSAAVTKEDWRPTYFLEAAGVLFAGSAAAALLLSGVFMLTLQTHPLVFVYFAIAAQVAAPLLVSIAAYQGGNGTLGLVCLLVSIALLLSFYFSQETTELIARLLSVSSRALQANPEIFVIAVGVNVVLLLLLAGLSLGSAASLANGTVRFNPQRISKDHCVDEFKHAVPCCLWAPDPLLVAWLASASTLAAAWTIRLAFQIKVFTISGCIAQWYFAPAGTAGPLGAGLRSLRHATGASFGSLCLAGLVMSAAQFLRVLFLRCSRPRSDTVQMLGSVGCSAFCTCLEQLSKLSIVSMSMSGASFWQAGRDTLDLLRRNAMDAYSAWWFPPVVLHLASTILSCAWGFCVYYCALWYWAADAAAGSATRSVAWQSAIVLAVMSGLLAFLALHYFCGIILNVLDAVFVCYAIDRDHGTCSRIDVHEVYIKLPGSYPPHDGFYHPDDSHHLSDHYHYRHHSLDSASSLPHQAFAHPSQGPIWQHSFSGHSNVSRQPHAYAKLSSHPVPPGASGLSRGAPGPAWGAPQAKQPPYPVCLAGGSVVPQPTGMQSVPQYLPIATSYGHVSVYGRALYGGQDDDCAPSAPPG